MEERKLSPQDKEEHADGRGKGFEGDLSTTHVVPKGTEPPPFDPPGKGKGKGKDQE
jgi:hypothetical protein